MYHDGTFTGSLLCDSAILVSELLLASAEWRDRVRGSTVVELGCGLGLPGWVAHLLGARAALLTDRGAISDLVEAARAWNGSPPSVAAVEFPWSNDGAKALLSHAHLNGTRPDVLLACDCIFTPLFGGPFLLLEMLTALAGPHTAILVALERRPDDGAEDFFAQASAAGFATKVLFQRGRVVCLQMRESRLLGDAARAQRLNVIPRPATRPFILPHPRGKAARAMTTNNHITSPIRNIFDDYQPTAISEAFGLHPPYCSARLHIYLCALAPSRPCTRSPRQDVYSNDLSEDRRRTLAVRRPRWTPEEFPPPWR